MRLFIFIILIATAGCQPAAKQASETDVAQDSTKSHQVTLEQIKEGFNSLKGQGIDPSQPLLYKFFFKDSSAEAIKGLQAELEKQEFKKVALYEEEDVIFLNMEQTTVHTPETLYKINEDLHKLASKYKVDQFDGFEIGNPIKPKGIPKGLINPDTSGGE